MKQLNDENNQIRCIMEMDMDNNKYEKKAHKLFNRYDRKNFKLHSMIEIAFCLHQFSKKKNKKNLSYFILIKILLLFCICIQKRPHSSYSSIRLSKRVKKKVILFIFIWISKIIMHNKKKKKEERERWKE